MSAPQNESSLRESVAAEIRAQLARRRLSGREVARRLDWTSPYLSRRLSGEVAFDVADLEALADLLNVPVTSFLEGPPAPVIGFRRAPTCTPLLRSVMPDRTWAQAGIGAAA